MTHFIFQFQEIVKPNYNSVDLVEVELVHDPNYDQPRHNNTELFRVGPFVNPWGSVQKTCEKVWYFTKPLTLPLTTSKLVDTDGYSTDEEGDG